ncbi:hypothetical protein FKM82_019948 [Ascaphus truei]
MGPHSSPRMSGSPGQTHRCLRGLGWFSRGSGELTSAHYGSAVPPRMWDHRFIPTPTSPRCPHGCGTTGSSRRLRVRGAPTDVGPPLHPRRCHPWNYQPDTREIPEETAGGLQRSHAEPRNQP